MTDLASLIAYVAGKTPEQAGRILLAAETIGAEPLEFCAHRFGLGMHATWERAAEWAGLAFSAVLIWAVRRVARDDAAVGRGSQFSLSLVLVLVALFCTVLGHFGLQPMMAAARAGQGAWSFGALHGLSTVLFGIKALALVALSWRLAKAPG